MLAISPHVEADTILVSAEVGTDLLGGNTISSYQWIGVRFTTTQEYVVNSLGGHVWSHGGDHEFILAIFPLDPDTGFPSSRDLEEDAFFSTTATFTTDWADQFVSVDFNLPPGDWGFVIGADPLGATGWGAITNQLREVGTPSYFAFNENNSGTCFFNHWTNCVGDGYRFVILGVPTQQNCGNGLVEEPEDCDDGNSSNADTCLDDCTAAYCGDGFAQTGVEVCDDGNGLDCDGCRADCSAIETGCGDGFVCSPELCDEGFSNSDSEPDACRTACVPSYCGDGVIDLGESCDEGEYNSDVEPGTCRMNCAQPSCGDGVRDETEGCDDGPNNSETEPDACRETCIPSYCGDGVIDSGEVCDFGQDNNDLSPDVCRTDCLPAYCGDGVIDTGEECDSPDELDECTLDCELVPTHTDEEADTGPVSGDMSADPVDDVYPIDFSWEVLGTETEGANETITEPTDGCTCSVSERDPGFVANLFFILAGLFLWRRFRCLQSG